MSLLKRYFTWRRRRIIEDLMKIDDDLDFMSEDANEYRMPDGNRYLQLVRRRSRLERKLARFV